MRTILVLVTIALSIGVVRSAIIARQYASNFTSLPGTAPTSTLATSNVTPGAALGTGIASNASEGTRERSMSTSTSLSPPLDGTGLDYASSCHAWKTSLISASGSILYRTLTVTTPSIYVQSWANHTIVAVSTSTSWNNNRTRPAYTLCDGYPRIDASTTVTEETSWIAATRTYMDADYVTERANVSLITWCTIQASDCSALNSSWKADISSAEAYLASSSLWRLSNAVTISEMPPFPAPTASLHREEPQCGYPQPFAWSTVGPPNCGYLDAHVRLLYWPKERSPGALCGNKTAATTASASVTQGLANTVVMGGTVLTSPTVYLMFEGNWTYTSDGLIRTVTSHWFIPQAPKSVSSYRYSNGGVTELHSMDYADLVSPVPASAYRAQASCFDRSLPGVNLCSTIWDDFQPILSVPPEFRDARPSLGDCGFYSSSDNVLFDPPKALQPQAKVAGVTRPAKADLVDATQVTPTPEVQAAETGEVARPTTPRETSVIISTRPNIPEGTGVPAVVDDKDASAEAPDRAIGDIIANAIGQFRSTSATSSERNGAEDNGGSDAHQALQENSDQPPTHAADIIASVLAGQGSKEAQPTVGQQTAGSLRSGVSGIVLTASNGEVGTIVRPSVQVDAIAGTASTADQTTIVPGVGTVVLQTGGAIIAGSSQAYSALEPKITQAASALNGQNTAAHGIVTNSQGSPYTISNLAADQSTGYATVVPGLGTVIVQSNSVVINGKTQAFVAQASEGSELPPIGVDNIVTSADGSVHTMDFDPAISSAHAIAGVFTGADGSSYTVVLDPAVGPKQFTTVVSGLGIVLVKPTGVVVDGVTQAFRSTNGVGFESDTTESGLALAPSASGATASEGSNGSASAITGPATASLGVSLRGGVLSWDFVLALATALTMLAL